VSDLARKLTLSTSRRLGIVNELFIDLDKPASAVRAAASDGATRGRCRFEWRPAERKIGAAYCGGSAG
jgi:hypothetical protein